MRFRSLADLRADTAFMAIYNQSRDAEEAAIAANLALIDENPIDPDPEIQRAIAWYSKNKYGHRLWEAKFRYTPLAEFFMIRCDDGSPNLSFTRIEPRMVQKHPLFHNSRLHISIPANYLEQATESLVILLTQSEIFRFSIFVDQRYQPTMDMANRSATKIIINLGHEIPDLNVGGLIGTIEKTLREAGIPPGRQMRGYHKIAGSDYIAYSAPQNAVARQAYQEMSVTTLPPRTAIALKDRARVR